MNLVHQRRECGCYPDPGTPPERWHEFLWGSPHNGTCSIPFLDHAFRTLSYHVTVTVNDDGTWSYEQDTVLKIVRNDQVFHHTDRNTLKKVGEPTPNWLMRKA